MLYKICGGIGLALLGLRLIGIGVASLGMVTGVILIVAGIALLAGL